jgi:hypothetical protein
MGWSKWPAAVGAESRLEFTAWTFVGSTTQMILVLRDNNEWTETVGEWQSVGECDKDSLRIKVSGAVAVVPLRLVLRHLRFLHRGTEESVPAQPAALFFALTLSRSHRASSPPAVAPSHYQQCPLKLYTSIAHVCRVPCNPLKHFPSSARQTKLTILSSGERHVLRLF